MTFYPAKNFVFYRECRVLTVTAKAVTAVKTRIDRDMEYNCLYTKKGATRVCMI